MCWYNIIHDFAAPVATTIAAGTAVLVTWRLGKSQVTIARQQAQIASQQAETALDRLRYDVFEQRCAIYIAAQRLIELSTQGSLSYTEVGELHKLYNAIDKAPFFFPQNICDFLSSLGEECATQRRRNNKKDQDWNEEIQKLWGIADSMPKKFFDVLAFSQLTKNGSDFGRNNREAGSPRG